MEQRSDVIDAAEVARVDAATVGVHLSVERLFDEQTLVGVLCARRLERFSLAKVFRQHCADEKHSDHVTQSQPT